MFRKRNGLVGCRVEHYRELTSTMDRAHELVAENTPGGTVVVADHQTAGRGRRGRQWRNSKGDDLSLSIILYPDKRILDCMFIITSLAVGDCVKQILGRVPQFKWPNDVLYDGHKIAGIIVETSQKGDFVSVITGIGLNVNMNLNHTAVKKYGATSLMIMGGGEFERAEVFAKLLEAFEARYIAASKGENPVGEWSRQLIDVGRQVEVVWKTGTVGVGIVIGADDGGRLMVRTDSGEIIAVTAEEVNITYK